MNYIKEEKDLNLKELFLDVISKWRSIMMLSIIALLVVFVINVPGAKEYKNLLGTTVVIKALAKYVILAFLGTMFMTMMYYAFIYMFSDKIKSASDYNLSSNVKLLGVIPREKNKRNLFIDKIIKRFKGIKILHSNRDNLLDRVANVISAETQIRSKDICKVAVVSSYTENVANKLIELLNGKINDKMVEIVLAGDILISEKSINTIMESDFVILAEQQDKSKYSEMEQTCKQLASWNKEILGTILLDVEAL